MNRTKTMLCCIFNTPSLYRELIYKKIEETYDCDWYFEDTDNKLKEFNTDKFRNVVRLHSFNIGPFYGVKGLVSLLFRDNYNLYLMMGHSRNLSTFLFLLLKRLFFKQKRAFLWTHGFYGKEAFFEKFWKKILLNSADGLLIYGDYACNIMKNKYGFDGNKLYPIHNSLDYDAQLMIRKSIKPSSIYRNHFNNENKTLIFIGRLTFIKKLHMIIQAIADLRTKGECYNLVFVGDGPSRNELENMAINLDVSDRVWFYGACYDEIINAELVYNADLCVSPGNIGLTSIHVLMFGCPAISNDDFSHQMPEFEAIKEHKTGLFFQRDNQGSLNESISKWFSQKDYNRDRIRNNCYKEIDSNWNTDYQMRIINKILNDK